MTTALALVIAGSAVQNLVEGLWAIARKPILIFLVTLAFVILATVLLVLSGLVFHGWWQGFLLELGVGLLVAGVVEVAVLSLLHSLIEGDGGASEIQQILETISRIENQLADQTVAPSDPKTADATDPI
jgi:hypothetical protein